MDLEIFLPLLRAPIMRTQDLHNEVWLSVFLFFPRQCSDKSAHWKQLFWALSPWIHKCFHLLLSRVCPSLNCSVHTSGCHPEMETSYLHLPAHHWAVIAVGDQRRPSSISQRVTHPCAQTCPAFKPRQPPTGFCIPWLKQELLFLCLP